MGFPAHKTKIVCTIGPASDSPELMERMIRTGMNVARLNFSNGDFSGHEKAIRNQRAGGPHRGALARQPQAKPPDGFDRLGDGEQWRLTQLCE